MCCVEGYIYLVAGTRYDRRVTEYNLRTNTWRNLPSFQQERRWGHIVCTLDNKIFVLGGVDDNGDCTTCEMLDLSDDDPHCTLGELH